MANRRITYEERLAQQRRREEERAKADIALKRSREDPRIAVVEALSRNDSPQARNAFLRLYNCAGKKLGDPRFKLHNKPYLHALHSLATWHEFWVKQPEEWKCRSNSPSRQFSSIARHLLAKYDMPGFMDSAWFVDLNAGKYQSWFVCLGAGENIRKQKDLPIELTKKMAHEMMQAPAYLTIDQAIRWGQIHGLGGGARCALAINGTMLGRSFQNDDFWQTVIRFFISNPMLDTVHYGPIVDYIQNQRFIPQARIVRGGIEDMLPPQPNLTMAGRTAEGLLRQVEQWHSGLAKKKDTDLEWVTCGIPGIEFVEGTDNNKSVWRIAEMLSSAELKKDGSVMRHCVSSYSYSCKSGRSAIYSMSLYSQREGTVQRRLTIEVAPQNKAVVQARGFCNQFPGQQESRYLSAWASKNGLSVSSYTLGG